MAAKASNPIILQACNDYRLWNFADETETWLEKKSSIHHKKAEFRRTWLKERRSRRRPRPRPWRSCRGRRTWSWIGRWGCSVGSWPHSSPTWGCPFWWSGRSGPRRPARDCSRESQHGIHSAWIRGRSMWGWSATHRGDEAARRISHFRSLTQTGTWIWQLEHRRRGCSAKRPWAPATTIASLAFSVLATLMMVSLYCIGGYFVAHRNDLMTTLELLLLLLNLNFLNEYCCKVVDHFGQPLLRVTSLAFASLFSWTEAVGPASQIGFEAVVCQPEVGSSNLLNTSPKVVWFPLSEKH